MCLATHQGNAKGLSCFSCVFYLSYFSPRASSGSMMELDTLSWPGGLDGQKQAARDCERRTSRGGGEVSVSLLQ